MADTRPTAAVLTRQAVNDDVKGIVSIDLAKVLRGREREKRDRERGTDKHKTPSARCHVSHMVPKTALPNHTLSSMA